VHANLGAVLHDVDPVLDRGIDNCRAVHGD
jgi:hypothetical protein